MARAVWRAVVCSGKTVTTSKRHLSRRIFTLLRSVTPAASSLAPGVAPVRYKERSGRADGLRGAMARAKRRFLEYPRRRPRSLIAHVVATAVECPGPPLRPAGCRAHLNRRVKEAVADALGRAAGRRARSSLCSSPSGCGRCAPFGRVRIGPALAGTALLAPRRRGVCDARGPLRSAQSLRSLLRRSAVLRKPTRLRSPGGIEPPRCAA